jgi:hypothetical protein
MIFTFRIPFSILVAVRLRVQSLHALQPPNFRVFIGRIEGALKILLLPIHLSLSVASAFPSA